MQTRTREAQIKEKERVKIRKAGKSKGLFDYLTELMKSKLQRGENVGEYRKETLWRRSRKDLLLATGKTSRKSFIFQMHKIDFSSGKRWLRGKMFPLLSLTVNSQLKK